jgi:dGTPase
MLQPDEMEEVTLWRENHGAARERWPDAPFSILRYQTVRRILDAMASDLVATVEREIERRGIRSVADVRAVRPRLVEYSPQMAPRIRELKDFLMDRLYMHVRVTRMGVKAKTIITGLFHTYFDEPRQMPPHVYAQIDGGDDKARVIADYIAGMTDRFALDEYKKLFDPLEKV